MDIRNSGQKGHRRVVITGLGVISALGLTLDDLWTSCREGRSGVRPVNESADPWRVLPFVAPIDSFTGKLEDFGPIPDSLKKTIRKGTKLMSREIQMAVASAERTLDHAGVGFGSIPGDRVGISFASDHIITTPDEILDAARNCAVDGHFDFSRWGEEGVARMTPLWQLKFLPNMPTSHISIYNQFRAHCNAITNREASIGAAVAESQAVIASGRADVMLVGATGSRLHPLQFIHAVQMGDLAARGVAPEEASRPFDADRTGMVLGEGAASVLLEDLDHALARNATIYGEVLAASHRFSARPKEASILPAGRIDESLANAMRDTLTRAHFEPDQLGFIDSCGFSSPTLDAMEAQVIRAVLGDAADRVPVTALKGHLGNPGAGSGALELVAGVLALHANTLYPVLNYHKDDPQCPIRPVRQFGEPAGNAFLKLAFNQFGQASAVLVTRFQE